MRRRAQGTPLEEVGVGRASCGRRALAAVSDWLTQSMPRALRWDASCDATDLILEALTELNARYIKCQRRTGHWTTKSSLKVIVQLQLGVGW